MPDTPQYLEETVAAFLAALAAPLPAPAAGSALALVGALAAGLVEKSARLSTGHWARAAETADRSEALRARLGPLAREDAQAYTVTLTALRAAGGDPELRAAALALAADTPLAIAEAAAEVAHLAAALALHGNPTLRTDAQTAALLAEAATRSAAALVETNLDGSADERIELVRSAAVAAADARSRALT